MDKPVLKWAIVDDSALLLIILLSISNCRHLQSNVLLKIL
jgi:hypothetical protein